MIATKIIGMLSVLAMIIILVAAITPGWMIIHFDTERTLYWMNNDYKAKYVAYSLWYAKVCETSDFSCHTHSFHDLYHHNEEGFKLMFLPYIEAEIETTLGAIFILIAAIMAFMYPGSVKSKIGLMVAAFLLFGGGILTAIPTGRFVHVAAQLEQSDSEGGDSYGLSDSLKISGAGIFITLIAFCLLVFVLIRMRRRNSVILSDGYENAMTQTSLAFTPAMTYELQNTTSCSSSEEAKNLIRKTIETESSDIWVQRL